MTQAERIQTSAAARMLGVTTRTVQSLAARGELPGTARVGKVWTFDRRKLADSHTLPSDHSGSDGGLPALDERTHLIEQMAASYAEGVRDGIARAREREGTRT